MASIDVSYHALLHEILEKGYTYKDPNRKDVNRIEILSHTFRHDFKKGFPAITTKKLNYKNVVTELIWFLSGDTNIKYLVDNDCNIWNKDAYKYYLKLHTVHISHKPVWNIETFIKTCKQDALIIGIPNYKVGDLGPVYGKQWRNFNGIDQISKLIQRLKDKPLGTEHIVNSWNAGYLSDMALPPCHYGFQIVVKPLEFDYVADYTGLKEDIWFNKACKNLEHGDIIKCNNKYYQIFFGPEHDSFEEYVQEYGFELHWNQRSVDTFLGLPYNIASYATLALILEKITGYKALAIQGNLNKVHLYDNSLDAVKEQLSRDVLQFDKFKLKIQDKSEYYKIKTYGLEICSLDNLLSNVEIEDFELENYESYPAINVKMLERDA
jgi:thymidylate synthase